MDYRSFKAENRVSESTMQMLLDKLEDIVYTQRN
jgi:hypothetical protein